MHIEKISLSLSWSDEEDVRRIRKFENEGDTFSVKIIANDKVVRSQKLSNLHNEQGIINLEYNSDKLNDENFSTYIEVELIECGDFYPAFGGQIITIKDESNSFTLNVDVTYRDHN